MRNRFLLAAAAALALHASPALADTADLVDPLIGTGNGGNVFPGADTPFGMVQFSPDETSGNQTANVNSGGYNDSSTNKIRGFGLAHVSAPAAAASRVTSRSIHTSATSRPRRPPTSATPPTAPASRTRTRAPKPARTR